MNTIIEPVSAHGNLTVYRRKTPDLGMPRFIVYRESDGKALEEFRQYRRAAKWADANGHRDDCHLPHGSADCSCMP